VIQVIRWPKLIYQLILNLNAFDESAYNYSIERDGVPPSREREVELRKSLEDSSSLVRIFIGKSLLICVGILILAWITFSMLSTLPKYYFLSSAFLLLWAVLGLLGWEIQTIAGGTLPELANKAWYRTLHIIGMYLLFIAIFQSFG